MVSMSKAMSAGQAGTYFSKDNYYIKNGVTELGKWGGKTADVLGLSGDVEQKNFIELLNGYAPNSLTNEQIKELEKLNKTETALTTEAEKLSKMEDSEEKTALKEALDTKIKSYNETRADFHKDVKTDGLHSKIKSLKEEAKNKPELLKKIKALEKEMNGTVKSDFRVGDSVIPSDRENRGTIVGFEKDGRAKVSFVNPETKKELTKSFELTSLNNNTPREKGETNSLGGKDGQLVRDGQNEFGIAGHRAGFDITFSASKSISTMALVAGDERLIDVHKEAMQTAMNYLEKEFAQTRTYDGDGNRQRENTENLAYAQFNHYTSRATEKDATPDPQLHTHNFIMNVTKGGENFMSLEPQQLFAAQKLADQIYQNEIARGAKDLGYGIEWNKHGSNYATEIKGVNKELLDVLSSRTAQIEAIIAKEEKAMGREMTKEEKNNVTLSSRATKEVQDINKIKDDWNNTLQNNGHSAESLIEKTKGQNSDKTIAEGAEHAVKMAVENLHSQKAVFSEHEILFETLKAGQGTASTREIQLAIQKNTKEMLVNDTDTFKVGVDYKNNSATLYSSKKVLKAEANIEKAVAAGKNKGSLLNKEDFNKQFKKIEEKKIARAEAEGKQYHSLTQGQKLALEHIATSKDQFIGIQGDAGSGKTTALERIKHITQALKETMGDNVQLIGLAPTNIAAGNIQKDSGIESQTVDSFINRPDDKEEGKQQVYLVDESSMLDTIKMSKLIEIAESNGAKVVLIGDIKQLKPVGAGAMFDRLQRTEQMKFAQVTEVLRQKDGTVAKEVVSAFKNIETLGKGLDKLQETGNLIEAKNGDMNPIREQFAHNAAKDYAEHGMNSTIALISTNAERHEFNKIIRDDLIEKGAVAKEGKQITTLQEKRLNKTDSKFSGNYKVGDVLVANKAFNDIKTGTRAEISEINRADNTIKVSYKSKAGVERAKWLDAGKLDVFTAYEKAEKEFAVGDKVAFEKKDLITNSQNGETGIIKAIHPESGIWTVEKSEINTEIDPQRYPYIAHAYAMTVHKSQGQSIDRVHVFADSSKGGLSTNAGYVQMSRAKEELIVYTDSRENLEKAYKTEQLAENATDYMDTKQFSGLSTSSSLTGNSIITDTLKLNENLKNDVKQDQKDAHIAFEARNEINAIDEYIATMRKSKTINSEKAKKGWKDGLSSPSRFNMKNSINEAIGAGAIAKDLSMGIRYQQLIKTEAKLLARGEINLGAAREFMEKNNNFKNDDQRLAFYASQARERAYLDAMIKDGVLIKDKNADRYELNVSKEKFGGYRKLNYTNEYKIDIARGAFDNALNDALFNKGKGMVDSVLFGGGSWNPSDGKKMMKEAGLFTKDNALMFERLEARADRFVREGQLKKQNGSYNAKDPLSFRAHVNSAKDEKTVYTGEGEDAKSYKNNKKLQEEIKWIPGAKRIDRAILKNTTVNMRTMRNDIVNSIKYAKYLTGANDSASGAFSVVAGLMVGVAKIGTKLTVGKLYRGAKIAAKAISHAGGGIVAMAKEGTHAYLENYEKTHKPKQNGEKNNRFEEMLYKDKAQHGKNKRPQKSLDSQKAMEKDIFEDKITKQFGITKDDLHKEMKAAKDKVDEEKSVSKDSKDEKSMEKEEKGKEKEQEKEERRSEDEK